MAEDISRKWLSPHHTGWELLLRLQKPSKIMENREKNKKSKYIKIGIKGVEAITENWKLTSVSLV